MRRPPFPDPNSTHKLQVWNNAIFDDDPPAEPPSWVPLQPISLNLPPSPDPTPEKENLSPVPSRKPRPLSGTPYPRRQSKVHFHLPDEEGSIDAEIEATEKEIGRLKAQLEELRTKKRESDLAGAGGVRRGWVVPARFMEPKQSTNKKAEEETPSNAKFRRRGISLGPSEIGGILRSTTTTTPLSSASKNHKQLKKAVESPAKGGSVDQRRRAASLGPMEIFSATRSRQSAGTNKLKSIREGTWKPDSNGGCKKQENGLQSKTLFKKGEEEEKKRAASSKTPSKSTKSRAVRSRYSLVHARPTSQGPESKRRKWSLPEKDEEEEEEAAAVVKRSCVSLPGNVAKGGVEEVEEEHNLESGFGKLLPRVRTSRGSPESPRDSGPAKRVAELIGRRTHFGELAVGRGRDECCQNLDFEEEEVEEEEEERE